MIRRLYSRFRLVAPPGWAVIAWMLCFAVLEGPVLYLEWQVGMPLQLRFRPGWVCLVGGSALLGLHRAVAFHPYFQGDYLHWLKLTPWTVRKPLPAGPVELRPEDSLIVGSLMLWSLSQPEGHSIELLNTFLFSHILILVRTFWSTGVPGFGYCASLVPGVRPQALVPSVARPRGPDLHLPLRPRRSLAILGPFSLAHGRGFERGQSGSTSREGVWPVLRLAL